MGRLPDDDDERCVIGWLPRLAAECSRRRHILAPPHFDGLLAISINTGKPYDVR